VGIGGDMEKEALPQFCNGVSKNRSQVGMNYIPPIYVIQDNTRTTLSMLDHKILGYPRYKVVLKNSLDQLVQQIW
jgi:hypothetical protein